MNRKEFLLTPFIGLLTRFKTKEEPIKEKRIFGKVRIKTTGEIDEIEWQYTEFTPDWTQDSLQVPYIYNTNELVFNRTFNIEEKRKDGWVVVGVCEVIIFPTATTQRKRINVHCTQVVETFQTGNKKYKRVTIPPKGIKISWEEYTTFNY